MAAYLIGRDAESGDLLARAHNEFAGRSAPVGAARCAFWLALRLFDRGDQAQAGGWLGRARRLLDDGRHDCVEQGYMRLPLAMQHLAKGDLAAAYDAFGEAVAYGERFGDRDLVTLARHGQGRALINLGRPAEGVALLDEVMVAVTAGDASPIVAGMVYCSVLSVCREIFDLRRAREWTAALTRCCASQPDLVPYRGECLVHRAEILRLQGAWPDAMDEARRANALLSQPPGQPAVGSAFYQVAELHRLRGAFAEAEEAYRQAAQWLRRPRPGLAQLRLVQGEVDAARAAIRRALDESTDQRTRAALLGPCVEILLAAGDIRLVRHNQQKEAERLKLSEGRRSFGNDFEFGQRSRRIRAPPAHDGAVEDAIPIQKHRACVGFHRTDSHFVSARFRSGCETSRCQTTA